MSESKTHPYANPTGKLVCARRYRLVRTYALGITLGNGLVDALGAVSLAGVHSLAQKVATAVVESLDVPLCWVPLVRGKKARAGGGGGGGGFFCFFCLF